VIVEETDVLAQGASYLHAFVHSNGVMSDLGTLAGADHYSSAAAINSAGVIVGESDAIAGGATNLHAFVYRNGVMSDLGTLGRSNSSASAINSAGQIVGYVGNTSQDLNAFLFNGTNMVNLNDYLLPGSGWLNLATADGINDSGQITGSGSLINGEYHAYLLTPTGPFLRLSSPSMLSNGQFQMTVEGTTGRFAIFYSTNLADWVSLGTNTLSSASTNFTDTGASRNGSRFYRALLLP